MQYSDNYAQHTHDREETIKLDQQPQTSHHLVHAKTNTTEYKKLAGVYGVIIVCATIMSFVLGFDWKIWLEWFMGGLCIIFGSFKLIGYEEFIANFPQYDPLAARSKLYNHVYPFIELFLGFLFVSNLLPLPRDIATLIIFGATAYGIMQYQSKQSNTQIQCACLGNVIRLPLSTVSLTEAILMSGFSVIMIISFFVL